MTDFKTWLESDTSRELTDGVSFTDADTIKLENGDLVRLQGVNAPETAKLGDFGAYGDIEAGGFMSTEQVAKLAKELGFTEVKITGKAAHDRLAGDLYNPKTGESFRRRLAQEGILGVDARYDKSGLSQSADYGALLRTKEDGSEPNEWDKARALIAEAVDQEGGQQGRFRIAQGASGDWRIARDYWLDQILEQYDDPTPEQIEAAEKEASAKASAVYNPDVAALELAGRHIATGDSTNPFSDAWDVGLIGVTESMWGVVDMLGESIDEEWLAQYGKSGVQRARNRIADHGRIITDYKEIDRFWNADGTWNPGGFWDAVEYVTNNAALSLPYMGITAAATLAAPVTFGTSLAAPAAVYAGQTWNEMEGEKDAAVAVGAGVIQAALDRVGIGLVFKGAGKGPRELLNKGIDKLVADGMTREAAEKTIMAATRKELAGFAGDAAKVASDQLKAKALFKSVAGRVAAGALGEGATETLQETVAYTGATLGSSKQFDWNELNERQLQALIAGSTLGSTFSVPGAAYDAGAWADVAVRQAGADSSRLSLAGKHAEEEKAKFGRVSSNQENAAKARARAAQAGPNAVPSLSERTAAHKQSKKDKEFGERLVDVMHSAPSLWQGATRFIFQPEILEKSRTARMMADMFGGQLQRTFSGANYENTKHHLVMIYRNMVPEPGAFWKSRGVRLRSTAAKESHKMYQQLNAAIDPETKELNLDAVPDDLKPFVAQLQELGDKMWEDQKKFNPDLGYQKNYLLRYKSFDKKKIHKNKQAFADLLVQHFGYMKSEAIELANAITDSSEVNDFADILEGSAAAGKPGSHKERTLNLSEHADFQQFMNQDIFGNIAMAAKSAARYQAYQEFVGDNHSVLNQMLADMQAEGLDATTVNKIASQMKDYLDAESGNYKRATSPMGKKLEKIQKNLMTWMVLAGLPLATISSFVEAALITKGLTKDDIFGEKGLEGQGRKLGEFMWDKFGETTVYDNKLEGDEPAAIKGSNVLQKLGYYHWDVGTASTTSTAQKVGATEVSDLHNRLLEIFFQATGLTGWTNFTRTMRAGFAGDWLMSKLDLVANSDPENKTNAVQEAEEQLRNYGINVDQAVQQYLKGEPIPEAELRDFQFNWINDAVVLPQAANRPLIYQDPRFALFTQFQGFISAFTATQIPKLWGEYVKRGTPAMKYNAFATMTTMIMLGFASQYLKDLLKYAPGEDDDYEVGFGKHPYLSTPEYLQRGVRASGLLGTGERVLDQFFPIYETRSDNPGEWLFNQTTGESPSLGLAKRMIGGVGALVQGDVGKATERAIQATPLGVFTWFRQDAGEAASSWNFKGG